MPVPIQAEPFARLTHLNQGRSPSLARVIFCVQAVISPLLANIYLDALDRLWVKQRLGDRQHDAHLIRYADDFVILCARNPEQYLGIAKQRLDRLGLTLNSEKTRIKHVRKGFNFLGHTFILAPSKVTGKMKCFYYPSLKAVAAVKQGV